jgi:hypothetical protein
MDKSAEICKKSKFFSNKGENARFSNPIGGKDSYQAICGVVPAR